MNALSQLISTVVASSAVSLFGLWIAKSWLGSRITQDVKHTYDTKLENLKNDLRTQADLSASIQRRLDSGEEFVRSSAAKLMLERKKGAMGYQLESLKEIWGIIASFRDLASLANSLAAIDMALIRGMGASERKELMDVFFPDGALQKYNLSAGEKYRPFVSQEIYKAYAASVTCAAFVMSVAVTRKRAALDRETISRKFVSDALEDVLPGRFVSTDIQSDLLQIAMVMRELEDLVDQLIRSQISSGEDVDVESVRRVAMGSRDAVSQLLMQQTTDLLDARGLKNRSR